MATHDDVRRICGRLPGAVEGEGRFGFGVLVKGKAKGFCWTWMERVHPRKPKVENPGVLAIGTPGLGAKEVLVTSGREKYAVDPHYNGFPAVLVRMEAIGCAELQELLTEAWRVKAPPELIADFERMS